jgi:hypothetical protein
MQVQPKDTSKGHFYVSLAKSGLRIGGCVALLGWQDIAWFALAFLAAELLGIAEELV